MDEKQAFRDAVPDFLDAEVSFETRDGTEVATISCEDDGQTFEAELPINEEYQLPDDPEQLTKRRMQTAITRVLQAAVGHRLDV